jgi:hypothetical protein
VIAEATDDPERPDGGGELEEVDETAEAGPPG